MISLDNDIAGIEHTDAASQNSPWGGAMIKDSLIVGHSELAQHNVMRIGTHSMCTNSGLKLPFSSRLTVKNVTLVNFDQQGCTALGTCSHCKPFDGGAIVRTEKLTFTNAPNVASFPFKHATVIEDWDGTLTGVSDGTGTMLPYMETMDPAKCHRATNASFGYPASICKDLIFRPVAWNNIRPSSINEKDAYFTNKHGKSPIKWRFKSKIGFPKGWTAFAIMEDTHELSFANSSQFTNISYTLGAMEFQDYDHVLIRHTFKQNPDYFTTTGKELDNLMEV